MSLLVVVVHRRKKKKRKRCRAPAAVSEWRRVPSARYSRPVLGSRGRGGRWVGLLLLLPPAAATKKKKEEYERI